MLLFEMFIVYPVPGPTRWNALCQRAEASGGKGVGGGAVVVQGRHWITWSGFSLPNLLSVLWFLQENVSFGCRWYFHHLLISPFYLREHTFLSLLQANVSDWNFMTFVSLCFREARFGDTLKPRPIFVCSDGSHYQCWSRGVTWVAFGAGSWQ